MDPAVVLVDVDDAVLLANPAARALGIVRGTRLLVPDLLDLARTVRSGGSRRADVRLPGDLVGAGPRLIGVHGVRLRQRHRAAAGTGRAGAAGRHRDPPRPRRCAATSSPTSATS